MDIGGATTGRFLKKESLEEIKEIERIERGGEGRVGNLLTILYMIGDEGICRDWLCDNFMEWI